ncbi:alanine/glycine:cation symporter family protein [Bacillus sp. FJAT-45037]|uniref:alanine/glycine:cation symporter family protein n=1 Tax=Bacillus sp. FJAT-45037 TaxID=2011007 RepID=UPI000C2335F6|nr:amino acid carrier protein [Bacillus sp. FJAT-45037]
MSFGEWTKEISEFIWGAPMILVLLGGGLILGGSIRFYYIIHIKYIFKSTIGTLFKRTKHDHTKGEVTPFGAFSSALAGTVGANNLIGVPLAIHYGGPGALFWMWIVALVGMATILVEIILGQRYREQTPQKEFVGGPAFYMSRGLKWRFGALFFAIGLIVQLGLSTMVQAKTIADRVGNSFQISSTVAGAAMVIIVAILVFGGIKRIAGVMKFLIPIIVFGYVVLTVFVIGSHYTSLLSTFQLIISEAFQPTAAVGSFAGASIWVTARWGLARGLYSSEAGMGTAPIAHAAAANHSPLKQANWGIIAVVIDTLLICSLTGLAVVITNTWTEVEEAEQMLINAFQTLMSSQVSEYLLTVLLIVFVLPTVTMLIYYAEKQADFLFKHHHPIIVRSLYLTLLFIGVFCSASMLWNMMDIVLAFVVIPNMYALIKLRKEATAEIKQFIYDKKRM